MVTNNVDVTKIKNLSTGLFKSKKVQKFTQTVRGGAYTLLAQTPAVKIHHGSKYFTLLFLQIYLHLSEQSPNFWKIWSHTVKAIFFIRKL